MLDNTAVTHRYPPKSIGNAQDRALISVERTEKLELIAHLLCNVQQGLILCGPFGIGKSTLLSLLQDRLAGQWRIAWLQGVANLNFERIVSQLGHFLGQTQTDQATDLEQLRNACSRQQTLLIIDDAGELAAGLLDELSAFADSATGLQLVLALTYDDYHIKRVTDKLIDDLHFIELPPLNPKECGEFLQYLATPPQSLFPRQTLTEHLIAELYRDTHGIPGRILDKIPAIKHNRRRKKTKIGSRLVITFTLLGAAVAVSTFLPAFSIPDLLSMDQPEQTTIVTEIPVFTAENSTETTEIGVTSKDTTIAQSSPSNSEIKPASEALDPPATNTAETDQEPVVIMPVAASHKPEPPPVVQEQVLRSVTAAQTTIKALPESDDKAWIMAQAAENYTLQVMVLGDKTAVDRFLKKYADYHKHLKYYLSSKNAQPKFVLIYGSFKNLSEARAAKTQLPFEFKQSLEIRFKYIQNENRH